MISIIHSNTLSFITRLEFSTNYWNDKLEKVVKVTTYPNDKDLLYDLKFDFHLSELVIKDISEKINGSNFKFLRIRNKAFEGFKYEVNFLELHNLEGKLIYFEDCMLVNQK